MEAHSQEMAGESPGACARVLPLVAMGAVFGLAAAGSFLPESRLWGVNHLAFYPWYVRLPALALPVAAALPAVARRLQKALARAAGLAMSIDPTRTAMPAAAAALSAAVFWLLRSSSLLLGDARLVASNFEHAFDPAYKVIVSDPRIILLEEPFARGTALIYHYAGRAALSLFGASPVDGIRLTNCVLGGLLAFILLRDLMGGRNGGAPAAWAAAAVATSGAVQLFFGYVENYTPLVFFGSLYVLSGLRCLSEGGSRRLVPTLGFLLLAVFMHVQGILLAPSFIWLSARRSRGGAGMRPARLTAAVLGLTAAGAFVLGAFTGYSRHFLPALGDAAGFGVLSPSHLADAANELLLLSPALPVAAVFAVCAWRASGRKSGGREQSAPGPHSAGGEDREGAPQGPAGRDSRAQGRGLEDRRAIHFASLVLIPCVLFLLLFKPDLGMARDWDLFAVTALGLVPLGIHGVARAGLSARRQVERLAPPAFALSAVLTLAWVGTNASPALSARRFEAILEYDRTRAAYAYEVLAQHYRARGDLPAAVSALEKGMSLSFNPRLTALAAGFYDEMGDSDTAVRLFDQVLERQPGTEGARRNLVLLLHRLGRYDELLVVSREGTRYHPESPVYRYFYGMALIDAGRIEEGVAELNTVKRLSPGEEVLANVDRALAALAARGYDVGAGSSGGQPSRPPRD